MDSDSVTPEAGQIWTESGFYEWRLRTELGSGVWTTEVRDTAKGIGPGPWRKGCNVRFPWASGVLVSRAPSPEAPMMEGRWPPRAGDVWKHVSTNKDYTFTGESTGDGEHRLWSVDGGGGFFDRRSTDGTLTFVRHATPDKPEPVREAVAGVCTCDTRGVCSMHPAKPHCRHGSYAEFCPRCLSESSPGIASLSLPPPRPVYVCQVSDEDLLPDVRERGWRR